MATEEIQNYLRILDAVPTNVPAFEALKEIFTEQENWGDLAKLYEDRANRLPDRSQTPDLYLQAAALRLHRLQNSDAAKRNIAKVLEVHPGHTQALALLRQVAISENDFATAIKVLRQESQLTEDNSKKSKMFEQIAALFVEKLNNKEHGAVAYHQAYLLDPSNLHLMEQALRYYKETGEWQRIIAVYRTRLEQVQTTAEKAKILVQIGNIFLHHLSEGKTPEGKEKASQLFREAQSIDPDCKDAKNALDELSYEMEDWTALLKRLKKDIRQATDDEQSAFINYKIAEGYHKREDKPAYAIRYCKQALELRPDYEKALDLIQDLYSELGRWEVLAEFLLEQVKRVQTVDEKVRWYKKLVSLYREQTRERVREISTLEQILEVKPDDSETLRRLESIYREEAQYSKTLSVMEKRLATLSDAEDKKALLSEMANLASVEIQRPDQAAVYYEKILELYPNDSIAIDALLPLYEVQAEWEKLINALKRKLDLSDERTERGFLLRRIGNIYHQRLALSKEAFRTYTEALRANPQDDELIQKLESLARQIGNWKEMIELYRNTLEQSEDMADQSALLTRIGDIYAREIGDNSSARSSYEEAIERYPHLDAFDALQKIYRRGEEWVALAELLREKASIEQISPEDKITVWGDLAWVRERQLDDIDGASEAYEHILDIDPAHASSLEALERLYKQSENWDALRQVYQRRIDDPASEEDLKASLHILGTLLLEKLQDLEQSVVIYQQLRVLDPQNNLILTRLDQLYRQLEQWDMWVETARQRVDVTRRAEQRKELLLEIAVVQEEKIDQPQEAIATLRIIHEIDPQDAQILDELLRLLEAQRDLAGQLEILRKKVDLTKDILTKKQLLFRMAQIYRQQQRETPPPAPLQVDQDVDTQMTPPPPMVDEAFIAQAEAAMARTYREILDLDGADLQALRALQAHYQLQANHEAVLELLLRERNSLSEQPEQVLALSQRIAQLETALGKFNKAIQEYEQILQIQPDDEVARETLEKIARDQSIWRVDALGVLEPIYRQNQEWEALAPALEARFTIIDDRRIRLDMAREIEEIYRIRLADDEKAFEWSCQLLREEFDNEEVRERVEIMAEEMERWGELLAVYEDLVRVFVDPEKIVETYLFIATNYQDRLDDSENALRNYRHVLDYDSQNGKAIDALELLYRQTKQWRELIDILRMRVRLCEDIDEKKEILFEVADIWKDRLTDIAEAIQVLSDILELDANDLKAIRLLANLYERDNHFQELAELWERERELLPDDSEELIALNYRLANLYNTHLQNQQRALELYSKVLEANLDHDEARNHVETLLENDDYRLICARILEPVYLHHENYPLLKNVYKIQLEDISQSTSERRKALMRLGQLHEDKLGEYREAFDRYLQVFTEEPGHAGTREALLRMAGKNDAWPEIAKAFTNGVEKIADVSEKIQTHLVLAQIYSERLGVPDHSVGHYRRIVDDLDPENLQAIEALELYYSQRQRWQPLIEILFQKEQALGDEVAKKIVFYQVADIYETQLQDNSQSILIFKRYLSRLEELAAAPPPISPALEEAMRVHKESEDDVERLVESMELASDQLEKLEEQANETFVKLQEVNEYLETEPHNEELQRQRDQLIELAETISNARDDARARRAEFIDRLEEAEIAESAASASLREIQSDIESQASEVEAIQNQRKEFQLETVRKLAELYSIEERWHDLVDIRNKEVALLDDQEDALALRFEVAQLWQERIGNVPKAIELYRAILSDDPEYSPALEALDVLREQDEYQLIVAQSLESYFREGQQDWVRLIEMVEIQLNHTEEQIRRIEFLKEIVVLYEEELDNPDMAFVYLCRAFREAPTDRDIISELERLAEETDAWEELVGVYEDEVENIDDRQLALRMYLKIANINDEALQDTEEAILNFQKALNIDVHNSAALGALDRLYRQERDWEALVEILERKVEVTEESREKITLLSRIANLWERELENLKQAIEAYRRILNVDAENHNALSALQRLYQQVERWDDLYTICLIRVDLVDSATERAKLHKKMASLCAQALDRPEEAISLFEQSLQTNEDDEECLEALEQLYAQTARWEQLIQTTQQLLSVVTGVERRKELYRTLGKTFTLHVVKEDEAIAAWLRVLELDPKDIEALDALRNIYEQRQQWNELVGILRRLIPLQTEDQEILEIYLRLASIYQYQLEQIDDAISAWRRVLELEPTHLQALETLETLLLERRDWRSVLDILEKKEAVIETDAEKIALLQHAAQICQDQLREPSRAIPHYERILEIDSTQIESIHALIQLYTKHQDWQKLIQVYNLEIQLLPEQEQQIERLQSIAQIYENQLFNKGEAFHTLIRAFECNPLDEAIRTQIERIAHETDRWDDLVEVYGREVEKLQDPDAQVPLWMRLAQIQHHELQEHEQAINSYRIALALDPNQHTALLALEELYEQYEMWYELIDIYQNKMRFAESFDEQKELLLKVAELREYQLNDYDGAIECYRQIQQIDPEDTSILPSLENLYRNQQMWQDLIATLEMRIERATSTASIFEMKSEIASVYDQQLDQPELAVDAYRHILNLDPNNQPSLQALEKLYTQLEQWEDLLQILTKEIELSRVVDEKVAYFYRMGIVWEEQLNDRSMAIENLKKILELDRWNLPALKGLARLYRESQEWMLLIDIYERHLKAIDDIEQMAVLYYQIGSIYQAYLGDHNRATTYYQRVLDSDPFYQPALSALGKLYEAAGNWVKCIEMMEREARVVNDPNQLVEVFFHIGKLYEERLVQIDRAKDSYRKALEFQPAYLPAIRSLKVIHFLQRDWDNVIKLSLQQERHTEDIQEKANLFCEIGKLYRERLINPEQSAEYYAKALTIYPRYVPAAKPLAQLYIDQKMWENAEAVLDDLLSDLQQQALSDDLYHFHYLLAYAVEQRQNYRKALYHYQESYNLNPDYFNTLNGLGRLYYSQQQWERSLNVYQTILYNHRNKLSDRERSEVYCRIGLAFNQMNQPDQAVDYYEQALEINPANPLALRALAQYAEQRGEWAKTLELKERLLLILDDEQQRFDLTVELGALCYEKLGQPEQAIDFYRQAYFMAPNNVQILYRLLDLYEECKRWAEKIQALENLAEIEIEPAKKIQYIYHAAETYQNKLQNAEEAINCYNRVLDIDFTHAQAFIAIESLLIHLQMWQVLDYNYQRMINRLPQEEQFHAPKLELWKKLGDLHRNQIQDIDKAVVAYELVYKLEPAVKNLEILADLYSQKDVYRPKAIEINHDLLQRNPARIESYKSLIRLYYENQQMDRSFAVCSTLRFLRETSPEEENFYKNMKAKAPDRLSRAFQEHEVWKQLIFHPQLNSPLTDILAILYQFCGAEFADNAKNFRIKKTDKVDPKLFFARTYEYVAQVLNLQGREVYQTALFPSLRLVNTFPPVILAGEDMFKERHPKELLFMIARQLTFSRPEFLFATVLPYPDFRSLISSFINIYVPNYPLDVPAEQADKIKKRITKTLPADRQEQLGHLVQALLQNPNPTTPEQFLDAVEHTANRAGFCLAGDLTICSKVCEREVRPDYQIAHRAKIKELVLFSISPEYFAFRERQGLAVKL
jgi:tetratricopeptide (TPR) repeat protein